LGQGWRARARGAAQQTALDGMVLLEVFQQQFQRPLPISEKVNFDSLLRCCAKALVCQAPDWPWFIKALELNARSIYGDLVIAQAKSTP
jgi:hypothetical protein